MRVAVLGLGRMGSAIAHRLLDAGHELSVWNRTGAATGPFVQRGAVALARPAEAFRTAEVCITMLADGAAVEAVTLGADGLLEGLELGRAGAGGATADSVLVDTSTISVQSSATVADRCERHGVAYLRAPVTGNPSVVAAGNLGIIVSGPRSEFDRLAGVLRDIGPNLFYVGGAEEARIVKLALNLMIAGTAQLISEAVVLAERHGIERGQMLAVMGGSAVGSPFVKYKTDALIADDYTSTFSATLMQKDLRLALDTAASAGVPLPATELTRQLIGQCIADGMGEQDFMALLPRLRREAGL
jgi:3-hydroxyisobutyrate dehydrogenase-like beta-hydroxyacid dehydrogenase